MHSVATRPKALPDDRPGAVLLRNSTPNQVNNPRSLKAEEVARGLLEARGIRIGAVLDEQGTSGKDLKRRPVASKLIAEIEAGVWAAVAVIEVSRTSRDPDGIDQRIFKRACRRGRALLLTPSKAYDFRLDADDLQYELEALLSGREWKILRKRTWEGSVARAHLQPIFFGTPPFGYRATTATINIRGTSRTVRTFEKDPDQAPLMTAIAEAFEAESGLNAIAWRLNKAGHLQPNGSPWYWSQVEQVLKRPLYHGLWTFGDVRSTGESDDLWEEQLGDGPPMHAVPHLAWYTEEQVTRWRRKCVGKGPVRRRVEGHPRPLIGILRCCHCRQPMTSAGIRGYCCSGRRDGRCEHGQLISAPQAEGAVRALLADVLPRLADVARRVRAKLEAPQSTSAMSDELRTLDAQISTRFEIITETKLSGAAVPPDFYARIKELQDQRTALAARLANSDRAELERRAVIAQAGRFEDPEVFLEVFDRLPADDQRLALAQLLKWVVVETNHARGKQAKAWVADHEPTFPVNSVSESESWVSWLTRFEAA